ncbi:BnaA04g20250D [Brassica napus]|uniref:BnaA04g20250D protein n=1 Tax=Brassica napus TaxID=3708 RepID=A0A078I1J5_BRANA|nr:BnaA04g20250D [Brassica napus]
MVVVLQPVPKCKTSSVLIPVVDLADPTSKTQIVKACEELGFFKVVNHGSLKDKAGPADPFGYGSKRIGLQGDVGCVEYILLNANSHLSSTKTTAVFRKTPAIFREAVEEYMEEMKGMSSKVLEMVEEALGIEPKEKLSRLVKVKESDSCFRMNYYKEKEETQAKKEIGFGEHTDPQLISVLRSNDTEGLQICLKDGTWVFHLITLLSLFLSEILFRKNLNWNIWVTLQKPRKITIFRLRVMTNGRFKSVKHRVLTNTKRSRLSMIYFAGPPLTEKIAPLACLVPKQEDYLYKELTWSQYKSSGYKTKLGDYRLGLFEK